MNIQIPNEQSRIVINLSNENSNHSNFNLLQNNNQTTSNKRMKSKNESKIIRCSYRYIKPRFSSIVIISQPNFTDTSIEKQKFSKNMIGYRYLKYPIQQESFCSIKSKQFVGEENENQTKIFLSNNKDTNSHSLIGDIEEIPLSHTSTIIQSQQSVHVNQESDIEDNHSNTCVTKKKKISKAREKKKIMLQDTIQISKGLKQSQEYQRCFFETHKFRPFKQFKGYVCGQNGRQLIIWTNQEENQLQLERTFNKQQMYQIHVQEQSKNIEEFWLNESKIQQKEQYTKIADFLIRIINDIKFVDLIEHYHTKL